VAQPALVFAIVDIHDLTRFGFVSTSFFLDLVWGKVELKLKGVHSLIKKNLMPFCEGLPCEKKECGSLFNVYRIVEEER
jgi:hypothetical protein